MTPEEALALAMRRIAERKLYLYRPYGHVDTLCPDGKLWKKMNDRGKWREWSNKPWQLDFHAAGNIATERMLLAANRVGKTLAAAAEVAMHATLEYPDWWTGRRFQGKTLSWVGAITNESSRDVVQKEVLGGSGEDIGTGMIPGDRIQKVRYRQAGVGDVVDSVTVANNSGTNSQIIFKTYDQGWKKWQGAAPQVIWMDEEPDDFRIFTEARTRLLTTRGLMIVTFTPLQGETDLVLHFSENKSPKIQLFGAIWEDAPHLSEEDCQDILDSYPEHEEEARSKGVPMMGEGRIFTTPEEDIKVPPRPIPDHWARIKGVDFGIDHPAGVADLAWDRDEDVIYVTRTWKKSGAGAEEHAEAATHSTPWVPVAWPHDGTNREKSSGKQLKTIYREYRVKMLGMSARYDNKKGGGQPQEPIILEIQKRSREGNFKVFSTCNEFFEEYRSYHRKDGKIVSKRDDVLKSVMYAMMMKRFAITYRGRGSGRQKSVYTRPII